MSTDTPEPESEEARLARLRQEEEQQRQWQNYMAMGGYLPPPAEPIRRSEPETSSFPTGGQAACGCGCVGLIMFAMAIVQAIETYPISTMIGYGIGTLTSVYLYDKYISKNLDWGLFVSAAIGAIAGIFGAVGVNKVIAYAKENWFSQNNSQDLPAKNLCAVDPEQFAKPVYQLSSEDMARLTARLSQTARSNTAVVADSRVAANQAMKG